MKLTHFSAHCTFFFPWSITLRFGTSFRDRDGLNVNVSKFYQNPNFNIKNYDYDISILKFTRPIKFTKGVFPIKLPTNENFELPVGVTVKIAGDKNNQIHS
jgi:hypothetical protein